LERISSNLSPGPLTINIELTEGSGTPQSFRGGTFLLHEDIPHWYSLDFLSPYSNAAILFGIVLGLAGLIYILIQFPIERDKRRALRIELEEVAKRLDKLPSTTADSATPVGSAPSESGQPVDAASQSAPPQPQKSIQEQLKETQTQSETLTEKLGEIERHIKRLCDELSELSALSGVLYESIQHERTAGEDATGGLPFALAATVNHWISSRARHRTDLLELAVLAGVPNAKLATLQDTNQVSKGVSRFRFTDDGAWLWAPVPGSEDEFWAAPVDAQLMAMGKAPSQLDEMFEGMENARHGFRFDEIYRPCRLRRSEPNGDNYNLVHRGALKLMGAQSPGGPKAQLFETYAEFTRLGQACDSETGKICRLLAAWVWQTEGKFTRFGHEIRQIQESSTAPVVAHASPSQDDLRRVQISVQRELDVQRKSIAERLQQLEENLAAVEVMRLPTVTTPAVPPPPREPEISYNAIPRPAAPAVVAHVPSPAAALKVPVSQPTPPMDFPTARVTAVPLALEKKWHDAYLLAMQNPDSMPKNIEIPPPDLYVRRALNLCNSLRAADRSATVLIMHVKKDTSSNMVELHETDESPTGDIVCRVCTEKHTWQLAVAFGATGTNSTWLLFPGGTLGKSNFAPGYSALIEDIPSSMFFMQAGRPALLRKLAAGKSTFEVSQKMTLESPQGGKS
jgi:hypothetical protein